MICAVEYVMGRDERVNRDNSVVYVSTTHEPHKFMVKVFQASAVCTVVMVGGNRPMNDPAKLA